MPTYTDKFLELADAQVASDQYPMLKSVTLAQWILESGRGSSLLAEQHSNFGGLKWRDRMVGYAVPVQMATPSEPQGETWCKFADPPSYIPGYWQFIESGPYDDPANYAGNPLGYLEMLATAGYATDPNYVDKVWSLVPEAAQLLQDRGGTGPSPPPATAVRVAVVVGHNSQAPGAYSATLGISEYPFNTGISELMAIEAADFNIIMETFFRKANSGGYSAEIDECYAEVNAWNPALVCELHFNAASASANGCEMLYWHTSGDGKTLAENVQRAVVDAFGFRSRGVKPKQSGDRGARSLAAAVAPCIITEPFFGSNREDCERILGRENVLANAYLRGIRDAAMALGLMGEVEPPPPPPPSDMVTVTVPREVAEQIVDIWTDALNQGAGL